MSGLLGLLVSAVEWVVKWLLNRRHFDDEFNRELAFRNAPHIKAAYEYKIQSLSTGDESLRLRSGAKPVNLSGDRP